MEPVKILGAGLSGLSAAITLARADRPVTVYEKHTTCGARFKGDFEGLENWTSITDVLNELQTIHITPTFYHRPVTTLHMTDGKEIIKLSSHPPFLYIIKRGTTPECLDQHLMQQAREAGVHIQFNTTLEPSQADIIATGPSSTRVTAAVKGIMFETDHDDIAVAMVGKAYAPHGYSYLLVSDGTGCISTVCPYKFINIDEYFSTTYDTFCRLFGVQVRNPREYGGFGAFMLRPHLQDGGRILVGEAAGLQDLLWGFGMRYALTSGHLAGVSLTTGTPYPRLVRKYLSGKLKTSIVNRFWVERLAAYEEFLIRSVKKEQEGNHRQRLYKTFNPSLESRLVYPYARFYLNRKYPSHM